MEKKGEKYKKNVNKGRKEVSFKEKDLMWVHLRKERFPHLRKSKLLPRGDDPFKIIKKLNDNAYKVDIPQEFEGSNAFDVIDLNLCCRYASTKFKDKFSSRRGERCRYRFPQLGDKKDEDAFTPQGFMARGRHKRMQEELGFTECCRTSYLIRIRDLHPVFGRGFGNKIDVEFSISLVDGWRAYVFDHLRCGDEVLSLVEFTYNNNFHASINMAPFDALMGRNVGHRCVGIKEEKDQRLKKLRGKDITLVCLCGTKQQENPLGRASQPNKSTSAKEEMSRPGKTHLSQVQLQGPRHSRQHMRREKQGALHRTKRITHTSLSLLFHILGGAWCFSKAPRRLRRYRSRVWEAGATQNPPFTFSQISRSQEPEPMENNDRTLKELAMLDVVYQSWCIQYPQLEPTQSY
ncbi:hypothetical protein CR513_17178, partial [Mucuna pruriens]